MVASFKGTDEEALEFLEALEHSCARHQDPPGPCGHGEPLCSAHQLMFEQRALDYLLFMRRRPPKEAPSENLADG